MERRVNLPPWSWVWNQFQWFSLLLESAVEALYCFLQWSHCILQLQKLLGSFFMFFISLLNFSFCLCIAFLISTSCLCPLIAHWASLIWLFWIIFQAIPRFPFLWGTAGALFYSFGYIVFLDSSWSLNTSIAVFAFEEGILTANLYWRALRVKDLHQSPS